MGLRVHAGPTLTSLSLAQVRLRFDRMHRYRGMLGQSHVLRVAVKRRSGIVGASTPEHMHIQGVVPLRITAKGHGSRQMCCMDKFGFPRTGPKQARRVKGFQTGISFELWCQRGRNKERTSGEPPFVPQAPSI